MACFLPFLSLVRQLELPSRVQLWLRSSGRLTTNVVRKGSGVVGFLLVGCFLVLLAFVGCNRDLEVAELFILLFFSGIEYNCIVTNQLDLSHVHAGKIMGLVVTVGNFGAIAGPIVVAAMTAHQSRVVFDGGDRGTCPPH